MIVVKILDFLTWEEKLITQTNIPTDICDIIQQIHEILTHHSPVLLFYTLWKHQKTFRFSDVFRGYRKATPGCNGLKLSREFRAAISAYQATVPCFRFYQSVLFVQRDQSSNDFSLKCSSVTLKTKKASKNAFQYLGKCMKHKNIHSLFCVINFHINSLNSLHLTILFLYPLKHQKNQRLSDAFRGYRKRSVAWNGLITTG